MNLRRSLELAGQNLLNCTLPTKHHLPTFQVIAGNDHRVRITFHVPCHNLNRWWDAMLRLQAATGFAVAKDVESRMLANFRRFFDNSDGLCLVPMDLEGVAPTFYPHSFRENMLALGAMVQYRNGDWAADTGRRMLQKLLAIRQPTGAWDFRKIDYHEKLAEMNGRETLERLPYRGRIFSEFDPNVGCDGRMIEGLVHYYRQTGQAEAMELLNLLAEFHLAHSTRADGTINFEIHPTHTHSYLNTIKGLLLFGLMTGQRRFVDAIEATYRVSIRTRVVKESGFASHDFLQDCLSEVASTMDAAEIAMHLALNGYPEYFDDTERWLRSRILPSQITETPELTPIEEFAKADNGDQTVQVKANSTALGREDYRNLRERMIGGYGCGIEYPNSASYVYTDVTASVLHGLTEVYANVVQDTRAGLAVHLHFDYEDDRVKITSQRAETATVVITPKTNRNILVRIPAWTPADSVRLSADGSPLCPIMLGRYAFVPAGPKPSPIALTYALPTRQTCETTMGHDFVYSWRADQIIAATPNTDLFPYYPSP